MTAWPGTAIRGSVEPLADAIAAVIAATGGEPQATVVGRGPRTSALLASLANGAQCHALDFDDTHLPAVLHGSAAVAPVVFALAEWRHASGADALAAFIAGFELETRIGRVIGKATHGARLARDGDGRHVRRRGSRRVHARARRAPAGTCARPRGHTGRRAHAVVRHNGEATPSRQGGDERPARRAARPRGLHRRNGDARRA